MGFLPVKAFVFVQLSLLLVSCLTIYGEDVHVVAKALTPLPPNHLAPHYPPESHPPGHHHHPKIHSPSHSPVHPPNHPPVHHPTYPRAPAHPPSHPPVHPPSHPPVHHSRHKPVPPSHPPVHPPHHKPVPPSHPPVHHPRHKLVPPSHPPVYPPHHKHGPRSRPPVHPPVHPPTHPPAQPPQLPQRSLVAVQGIVYCKSCKYVGVNTLLGASPLLGAIVKLECNNTKDSLVLKAKTDKNGYFYIRAPKKITTYGAPKCKVSLFSSPLASCSKPTALHGGLKGAPLVPPAQPPPDKPHSYVLYNVGPFAFEPAKSTKCPR